MPQYAAALGQLELIWNLLAKTNGRVPPGVADDRCDGADVVDRLARRRLNLGDSPWPPERTFEHVFTFGQCTLSAISV
ncbi:hypothetical protein [Bradyrhizobium sp. BR 10261]|uniref:hypothetical protein n=1 Tax=Bradyrhizobium sp. BR 10261 TaxID=2749992 RepID=UPI001C64C36B|nr:hypothetical protein [Bradyrhizobium sp. BR 10261]MBW7963130.1 hypothetical protein [Bradyrhizobium sp. BR 10261]